MAKRVQLRDNLGRFEKTATIHITKKLEEIARECEANVSDLIEDKLLDTYKTNFEASYMSSAMASGGHAPKRPYEHTGLFLESIHTEKEDNTIKIVIKSKKAYPNGETPETVYEFLTKGTRYLSNISYPYEEKDGSTTFSQYYATPVHDFEIHTSIQMKSFLESLRSDIEAHPEKYVKYKRR